MAGPISFRQGSPAQLNLSTVVRGEPLFDLKNLIFSLGLSGGQSPLQVLMRDAAQPIINKDFRDSPLSANIITLDVTTAGGSITLSVPTTDILLVGVSPNAAAGDGTKFLRGDRVWAAPAGSGNVTYIGSNPSAGQLALFPIDGDGTQISHSPPTGIDPIRISHIVNEPNAFNRFDREILFWHDGALLQVTSSPEHLSPGEVVTLTDSQILSNKTLDIGNIITVGSTSYSKFWASPAHDNVYLLFDTSAVQSTDKTAYWPNQSLRIVGVSPSAAAGTSFTFLRGDGIWAPVPASGQNNTGANLSPKISAKSAAASLKAVC